MENDTAQRCTLYVGPDFTAGLCSFTDILWQAAYYKFISIDRKSKVESGERQNSFHL